MSFYFTPFSHSDSAHCLCPSFISRYMLKDSRRQKLTLWEGCIDTSHTVSSSWQSSAMGIRTPILKMKKLRLSKVRQFSQDYTTKLRFTCRSPWLLSPFPSAVPDRLPRTPEKYLLDVILLIWGPPESGVSGLHNAVLRKESVGTRLRIPGSCAQWLSH